MDGLYSLSQPRQRSTGAPLRRESVVSRGTAHRRSAAGYLPQPCDRFDGNLWLVWQGFRNGKSDIFARRYDGSSWSAAERVSNSPANDWEPAIAVGSNGSVYVAWDTYDKGNYDVMMRRYANGSRSDPIAVAATPKFEAHVSLACDRQNRLWAAWNESGFEWGKDAGFLVKKEATRLYESRSMAVGVSSNGTWCEPVAEINSSLPPDMRTVHFAVSVCVAS